MSRIVFAVVVWLLLTAHVGTNQVVFEGRAGAYPIRVIISPPGVVPAQVPIVVRVLEGRAERVTVRAAQWNVGTRGAPPAEVATVVNGEPGTWSHDLWIMTASSYAVHVSVEGAAGSGELVVPMQTSATRTLSMQRAMGVGLTLVGALLVAGLLSIVAAAAREGSVAPDADRDAPGARRSARLPVSIAAGVLALAVVGGAKWWSLEEAAYRRSMLRPLAIDTRVHASPDANAERLSIEIVDSLWRTNRLPPLLPDHGKLMHLFLARTEVPDSLFFAHLHPMRRDADRFDTALPSLPKGRYLLFGDLLFGSGFTRTLVDTVSIDRAADRAADRVASRDTATPPGDPDDSWRAMAVTAIGSTAAIGAGGSIRLTTELDDARIEAGRDLRLVAVAVDSAGDPVPLEPYMGMLGHAMVLRRDGGVFVHLHPMGTASMTAQAQLRRRERGDTALLDSAALRAALAAEEAHGAHQGAPSAETGRVAFPFVFPAAGSYDVVVQLRTGARVESAAFRVDVIPRP